jgi:hypothetical protein
MVDSLDASVTGERKALLLQNCYPLDPELGGPAVGRPGFRITEDNQLGAAGVRQTKRVYQYTQHDGTEYTIGFCGAKMYTYSWGNRAWTEVTLSGSGVALHNTAKVFCTTFNDKLIVNPNDGATKPFQWDGTTFTSLTNTSVMYGQPVVYYAKLFGIKWAERSTIIWSEENDPTTGYEAGGYNNAWTLGQTDQEPLHALYATNEALYYFRARSIGEISGAVSAAFSTDGVRDGVSESVGTLSPAAVVSHNRNIFFLSADGRPHMIRPGLGVTPLWQDCRQTLATIPRAQLSKAVAVNDGATRTIRFGLAESGQTNPTFELVFRYSARSPDEDPVFAGIWRGYTFQSLDIAKDASLVPVVVHGSTDGYFYDHGNPDGSLWDYELKAGTTAIDHVVVGTTLGHDIQTDKIFDRLDLLFQAKSDMTGLTLQVSTPNEQATESTAFNVTGGFAVWDLSLWNNSTWSIEGLEAHSALGLNSYGRWIRAKISHSATGERFGFHGWRVEAYVEGKDPATL